MPDQEQGGGGKGILADFKSDKAKWLGVAIAAASLIIAYLIFRRGQAQQRASASSVFPVQGTGVANATPSDLASQLGNLISMISAQNAQTQQEIAALTQQQAQQQAPGATTVTVAGKPWLQQGPLGIATFPHPVPAQSVAFADRLKPSSGIGGPEGVIPHGIGMPSGFTQHEFAPTDQVAALRGARQSFVHV